MIASIAQKKPVATTMASEDTDKSADLPASVPLAAPISANFRASAGNIDPRVRAARAVACFQSLTRAERLRIMAYVRHQRFDLAAEEVGCDRETISNTWRRFSGVVTEVLESIEALPLNP